MHPNIEQAMKIYQDTIVASPRRGHLSLQVPDVALGNPVPPMIDAPDEWFMRLHCFDGNRGPAGAVAMRPAMPHERFRGALYLTRAGYEANREQLCSEYTSAGGDWATFEAFAEEHFSLLSSGTQRYADKLAVRASRAAQQARDAAAMAARLSSGGNL